MKSSHLIIVVIVFALLNVWLILILRHASPPAVYPDSIEYIDAAGTFLQTGGFPGLSSRTPGYPFLLAVMFLFVGVENLDGVAILQHLMMLGCFPLLFYIIVRATGRPWPALAALCIAGLSFAFSQYSAAILSEVPAAFMFLVLVSLFQETLISGRAGCRPLMAALLLAGMMTAMIRAAFVIMPFALVIGLITAHWLFRKINPLPVCLPWRGIALFICINTLAVLGWCLHNWINFGTFGVTAILGGNLTNHTVAYLDDYSPRDDIEKTLVKIIIEARDRRGGHGEMLVWTEMPAMRAATGLTGIEICRVWLGINRRVIAEHPWRYLAGVMLAWRSYWSQVTFGYSPRSMLAAIKDPAGFPERFYKAVNQYWLGAAWFRAWFEWKFLAASAVLMVLYRRRRVAFILIAALALAAVSEAALSSLVEFGENYRYRAPHEPVLIGVVIWAAVEVLIRSAGGLVRLIWCRISPLPDGITEQIGNEL